VYVSADKPFCTFSDDTDASSLEQQQFDMHITRPMVGRCNTVVLLNAVAFINTG
jgi:hypothetical protein